MPLRMHTVLKGRTIAAAPVAMGAGALVVVTLPLDPLNADEETGGDKATDEEGEPSWDVD